MIQGIAYVLAKEMLETAKNTFIDSLRKAMVSNAMSKKRTEFMQHVAEQYATEVKENISAYVSSLGEASAEISYEGRPGQAFVNRAQMALNKVETYLKTQNPDGPIIQFLKERYAEEGIRIFTGNLYAGHYINATGASSVEIMNKMGYAGKVDSYKPWLSSKKTTDGIEERIMEVVTESFDEAFNNIDLSSDLALLKKALKKTSKAPVSAKPEKAKGRAHKGTIYITDGKQNRRVLPNQPIPPGWRKGRVKNWG